MNIDTTIPVASLSKAALFEKTRPAPEDGEGSAWSTAVQEDFAIDGFWDFWQAGTCYGEVPAHCKYCKTELYYDDNTESWVDDTDGDACPGADDGENENEQHVIVEANSDGHLTDGNGTCRVELCPRYEDRPSGIEGPAMSYWYPLGVSDLDPEEAARKIVGTSLCVVQVSGDYGLALTGGGQDLTWSIIEAFVRLGFLPPLDHNQPPKMAGLNPNTEKNAYLLAACRQSFVEANERITFQLGLFDEMWSNR